MMQVRFGQLFSRKTAALKVCLLLLPMLACALPTAVSTPSTPTPTPILLPTTAVLVAPETGLPLSGSALPLPETAPKPLAPYTLPNVTLPPGQLRYPLDLTAVGNPEDIPLLAERERAQLATDGWVILPDPYANPYDIYAPAQAANQPLFISQDLLLLATQTIHQEVINEARAVYLPFYVRQLTDELTAVSTAQLAQLESEPISNPLLVEAARRNLAYATMAGLFLEPAYPISPRVTDLVESELALAGQAGQFNSPLFGRVVDYTPLTTAVSPLERTLLWYRLYGWSFVPDSQAEEIDPDFQRAQARQIQLWLAALEPERGEAHSAWQQVAEPLAYLDGASGSRVAQWQAMRQQAESAPQPLDSFIQTVVQLPAPMFTLLPPPQDEHGRVMRDLSYNRVGGYTGTNASQPPFSAGDTAVGLVRLFPHSWDTAAAAGSDVVLHQLQATGDASFEGYAIQLSALREALLPAVAAAQSYETAWWLTLAPNIATEAVAEPVEAEPAEAEAYRLSRWQLGWLLSRTDVIPADFPPRAWASDENTAVYLDPQPVLYARLGAHTSQLLIGLGQAGWLSQPAADRLRELEAILLVAQATAVRQEAGQTLGDLERHFLADLLGRLHAITGDPALPFTAVVHTDPTTGQAVTLHAPSAYPLFTLAYYDGQPLLFTGATLLIQERK